MTPPASLLLAGRETGAAIPDANKEYQMKIAVKNPLEVVKEALWLAWNAGQTVGLGVLQAKPGASKNEVWHHTTGDPLGGDTGPAPPNMTVIGGNAPGRLYADYVFGRMLKLRLEWDDEGVTVPDSTPQSGYQSWSYKYASYQDLIEAASKILEAQPVREQQMSEKMNEKHTALQIETCMRFVGCACIAKALSGGEKILEGNFLEGFKTYTKIGHPIIARLTGYPEFFEKCRTPEGFKEFVLNVAKEVVRLLEHA